MPELGRVFKHQPYCSKEQTLIKELALLLLDISPFLQPRSLLVLVNYTITLTANLEVIILEVLMPFPEGFKNKVLVV